MIRRHFRMSYWLPVLLISIIPSLAAYAAPPPVIEDETLRVAFDGASGHLMEFTDKRSGHNFVAPSQGDRLWTVQLLPTADIPPIQPDRAARFEYRHSQEEEDALELVWSGFNFSKAPQLEVVVRVSLAPKEAKALWGIAVENTNGLPLERVGFPRIPGILPQEGECLAAPIWMGQLAHDPRRFLCNPDKPGRMEWAYPGLLSLQCIALYRENGPGLFLSADDTEAFAKRFCVFGDRDNGLGMEVIHLPQSGESDTDTYAPAYRVAVGAFEGDWFTAAERYREWALDQWWAKESRIRTNAVAGWAKETALWVWNRGRSDQVLTPAVKLRQQCDLPISVFWHWWHGCPYDIGFPEYLPPREGAEPFRDAVSEARGAGVNAMVYMNQRLWGMTTDSWEEKGAARYAVKGPDGEIHPEYYNTFTKAPCASMCMGTPFWRDTYAGLAEQAVVDLGCSAIYMDQACLSLACYDPSHGHPVGGGTYWINGFRLLQADIRERCERRNGDVAAHSNVVLAGEGCGEAWLPYLDLMLSLQVSMERYANPGVWEPIPFFHAVYHGYGIFFGNYGSLTMPPYDELWPAEFAPKEPLSLLDTKYSQQFRLEQARAFVWGQQPTIANFRPEHFEQRPEEVAYLVHLAELRMQALKYLLHGTMLRAPVPGLPDEEIDVSRLSIYAGQQGALKEYRRAFPRVLASAWQAADGDMALVFANVTDDPQEFSVVLPRDACPLPASCVVWRIDKNGKREIGPVEGDMHLEAALPASEACIYEFTARQLRNE